METQKSIHTRPPLPPFTHDTALLKVRLAEDAWNSCDPEKVALAYTPSSHKIQVPVHIPTPLRKLTQNQEIVRIEGATIRDVINNLEQSYPGLKERICDEQNNIRRFVNVFVNDEDIRFLQDAETAVKPGDEVSIFPSIAGG